jgi:hypothetical protein
MQRLLVDKAWGRSFRERIPGLPKKEEAAMAHRSSLFSSRCAPAVAAALSVLTLGATAGRAQTLPACVAGNNQTTCTIGNVVFSNPTGVFGSSHWRGESGLISDPFNPGFSTGSIVETSHSGSVSRSGSFTVATLTGVAAIAGLSASATCGVTGAASAGLSVSTDNGYSLNLSCQPLPDTGPQTVTRSATFSTPVSSLTVTLTASGTISSGSVTWTDISGQVSLNPVYYFPHLAFGGGWQTTLTYVNYSPQAVSCQTTFLSDAGAALAVPFAAGPVSSRTDDLQAGGSIHVQTQAGSSAAVTGWARALCTGPVKASVLFRYYSNGAPQGEAGVNAMTAPSREFSTFAESHTGVAWANPSSAPAAITLTVLDATTGQSHGITAFNLAPNAHGAANIGPLLNLPSTFNGSIEISSTVPIVSLSLNAEAFPVFSALPPGDLPDGTPLEAAH